MITIIYAVQDNRHHHSTIW